MFLTIPVFSTSIAFQFRDHQNAFAFDFVARQKTPGVHLNLWIWKQLPLLQLTHYKREISGTASERWIANRVLELTYTAWDLEAFALDCHYSGPPFRWDEERRFLLRCELDAAYFHLYLGSPSEWGTDSPQLREMFPTPRDAVDYIMDTFPIVRRKDEQAHGEYRTKRVILEIYDEMAEAIRTGHPYQTRLTPPPGPPTDADGNFIPMSQWDPANWPEHIHLPRETVRPVPQPIAATRLDRGQAVLDILLLLDAWKKPVSIGALEPALVLMRNEAARRALLSKPLDESQAVELEGDAKFVRGLDVVYRGLESNGAIRRVGESGFELVNYELLAHATEADRARAMEVVQAVQKLREDRLPQFVAAVSNERYEIAV